MTEDSGGERPGEVDLGAGGGLAKPVLNLGGRDREEELTGWRLAYALGQGRAGRGVEREAARGELEQPIGEEMVGLQGEQLLGADGAGIECLQGQGGQAVAGREGLHLGPTQDDGKAIVGGLGHLSGQLLRPLFQKAGGGHFHSRGA